MSTNPPDMFFHWHLLQRHCFIAWCRLLEAARVEAFVSWLSRKLAQ